MLDSDITHLKGIGPKKGLILKTDAGIETIEDFLYYFPRRYIDRSSFRLIKDCDMNEIVTVAGTIKDVRISGSRKKKLEVEIDDESDLLIGIFFGGIQYFTKIFTPGDYVIFSGKINSFKIRQIVHPEFDFVDISSSVQSINTGRIIPLYKSTESLKSIGFHSRGFRRMIRHIIDEYLSYASETLHDHLLKKLKLMGIRDALFALHFPDSFEQAEQARRRLAFNEVFFMQYYFAMYRKFLLKKCRKKAEISEPGLLQKFIASLPFVLTADQVQAIDEIQKNIQGPFPMNRLLQGDVGSGKTVVAMAGAVIAKECNRQTAVMAPTEILAIQHYQNFTHLMPGSIKIALLTGSTPQEKKEEIYTSLNQGDLDIIIGTHALIQGSVVFKDLGLTIIDEQHRFGVEQRSALRRKGEDADLLVMTATPIPRSLSLTLYGDLDVSIIRSKPADRKPITTMAFPYSRINGVYNSMEKYISQGRQVYYVLPLIEETEKLDLTSAQEAYKHLTKIFPHRKVALMHGRMKQKEREESMDLFKQGDIDIMVATTVIEVGIDVPNACIIIIEHAERFGLSQLHQLRGRVGRGEHQSFCILIYKDDLNGESMQRINTLIATDDGFVISEEDLRLRGAGEILGYQQHGHAGSWEFLDLNKDIDLIISSRKEAAENADMVGNVEQAVNNLNDVNINQLISGIRKKRILSVLS